MFILDLRRLLGENCKKINLNKDTMTVLRTIVKSFLISALAFFSLGTAANAGTQCRPPLPPVVPNEFDATKAEIVAALKNIRENFQPAIKNFQNCIATEKAAVGDIATAAQVEEWNMLFDAAYTLESQIAHNMNVAVRAYKARQAAKAENKPPEEK